MPLENIFGIINSLIPTPLGCLLLYNLTPEWKYKKTTVKTIILVFLFFLVLADTFLILSNGNGPDGKNLVSALNIPLVIAGYLLMTEFRGGRNLFTCFSSFTFVLAMASVGEIVGGTSVPHRFVIKIMAFSVIFFLVYYYFKRPFCDVSLEYKGKWLHLTFIPFCIFILYIIIIASGELYHDSQLQLIAIVLVIINFVTYISFYSIFLTLKAQYHDHEEYVLLREQMVSLQKQSETIIQSTDDINLFRHDIRHYINLIRGCVQNNDPAAVLQILDSMGEQMKSMDNKFKKYTGDILIDAVLSEYEQKSKKKNIDFSVKLVLTDYLLKEPVEFAVILSNGLENALHACEKMSGKSAKAIRITGAKNKQQYFFMIENTFEGKVTFGGDNRVIPVSADCGHGYGSKSIAAFAENYNAIVNYFVDDGWFKLQIIF